jgi:coenzyme F420-0:L-glutamate ligase/coenzyme F420-1:gamma-L-glutamate ligase
MPEVRPGDDLARLLLEAVGRAGLALADGDVLAVTSKVVAKAEGRLVPLPQDPAGRERALREAVAAETARVVARRGRLVIAETRHGLVGANALVDASNAGGDRLVLLPADPDASAARLRADLAALDGHDVAVVVTDTLGRPWRLGQTDVAVGLAGMGALDDWRGRADGDGRRLEVTEVAVADEVAAAADLVKGKASRVPAALLRGVARPEGRGRARDLVRPAADDLFRTAGTAEDLLAFLDGGPPPAGFLPDPVDPDTVERAVAAARAVPLPGGQRLQAAPVPAGARPACLAALSPAPPLLAAAPVLLACGLAAGVGAPGVELAAGGAVRTLVLGLHALGVAAVFEPAGTPARADALAAALGPVPWRAFGLLAAGRPGLSG